MVELEPNHRGFSSGARFEGSWIIGTCRLDSASLAPIMSRQLKRSRGDWQCEKPAGAIREPCVQADTLWRNARLATFATDHDLGIVENGAIAARDGRIVWVGSADALPTDLKAAETVDCGGRWITPGLIDCHTHLVFAGDRSDEFERRLAGESYADIARSGGGIASTVRATRGASEDELVRTALPRLDALMAEGVTTVEVKSGYGLDTEAELRMLRAARRLEGERRVSVSTTYLGAHAIPPGGDRAAYLRSVMDEAIPRIAAEGLAMRWTPSTRPSLSRPRKPRPSLPSHERRAARQTPRRPAQRQWRRGAGRTLQRTLCRPSRIHERGRRRRHGARGTVAVILPGAFYVLKETRKPPVRPSAATACDWPLPRISTPAPRPSRP
jgi:imidazolonepropionase